MQRLVVMVAPDRHFRSVPSDGYYFIDNPADGMSGIRGLGGRTADMIPTIAIMVIDRRGYPISGARVQADDSGPNGQEQRTDSDGSAIFQFNHHPSIGSSVQVTVDLPEGQVERMVRTELGGSVGVEVFRSIMVAPLPLVTLPEGIGFLAGLALALSGLYMKPTRTQEIIMGAGSGILGTAAFTTIYRHVK